MDNPRQFPLGRVFVLVTITALALAVYKVSDTWVPRFILGPGMILIMLVLIIVFTLQSNPARAIVRWVRR